MTLVRAMLLSLMDQVQEADVAPARPLVEAAHQRLTTVAPALQRWQQFQSTELPTLNQQLRSAGLPELK